MTNVKQNDRWDTLKEKIHGYILLYGLFMSGLYVVLMAYTFMRAFFTPQKAIILTIDKVGEANPEFVLLFVVVPVVLYTCAVLGARVYRETRGKSSVTL